MCVHAAQAPTSQHILTHICKHMCEFTEARHRPLSLFYLLPGYESQISVGGGGGGARESGSQQRRPQVCVFSPRWRD